MKKKVILTRILDAAIVISIVAALAILLILPFLGQIYQSVSDAFSAYPILGDIFVKYFACLKMPPFLLVMTAFYFTGFIYLIIAFNARRLTKSILHTTPFAMGNVMALRRIAVLAFVECVSFSALTIGLLVMHFSIFTTLITCIVAIASAFVSIIGAVLSVLLRSAIAIKDENDLTI